MTTRKRYTAEFKREAVRLSQQAGVSVVKLAEELGVSDHPLYQWRKQAEALGDVAFPGNGTGSFDSRAAGEPASKKRAQGALSKRVTL